MCKVNYICVLLLSVIGLSAMDKGSDHLPLVLWQGEGVPFAAPVASDKLAGLSHGPDRRRDSRYKCIIAGCEYVATNQRSFDFHHKMHNYPLERARKCATCGYLTNSSTSFKLHQQLHSGQRSYVCKYPCCGKAFSREVEFKQHERIHTGEKPYMCGHPGCGKLFALLKSLQRHARSHSGEKPYVCAYPGCGSAFNRSENLRMHELIHEDKHEGGDTVQSGREHAPLSALRLPGTESLVRYGDLKIIF